MPQQPEVDHLGQGLTVSRWVNSHVGSFWRRAGSTTPPGWDRRRTLRLGEFAT
jgi:hypothetical protein